MTKLDDRLHQIHNARCMQQWRGTRQAAEYLRATGWSVDAALYILLNK